MITYAVRRVLFSFLVIWGAVTIIFIVVRVVPGDPASMMLGPEATPAEVAELRQRLGLDVSIPAQYLSYLRGVVVLDFGESLQYGRPAMAMVGDRLPATVQLAIVAMAMAIATSVPLGVAAGRRPGSRLDRLIAGLSLGGQALPTFWVGIVLILVFARWLQWLPSVGSGSVLHFILPAATLALPSIAILVRLTRSGLVEVSNESYVMTARSKGLAEARVVYLHALRNALVPVVTVAGLRLGGMLGGAVIVEAVFSWPGVGSLLLSSITFRDFPVVQAATFSIAAAFVFANLTVDLSYGLLDPRIRVGGAGNAR